MKTLTGKFVVFIIIPVVFIQSALSLSSYLLVQKLLIDQLKISGKNFLRASAEQVSARIVQIQSTLELMAITEQLEEKNDSERHRFFVKINDLLGGSTTSVFMGFSDGKFVRSKTTPLPKDYDPRTRPWYLDALDLLPGVMAGVTKPYLDASTKRPTITLYHKVVNPTGELMGVLGVDVDIALASRNLMVQFPVLENGQNILVDSDAVVLLHPDKNMIGSDIGNSGVELDMQLSQDIKHTKLQYQQYLGKYLGEQRYLGFYRVQNAPICFVLNVPAKTVLKPLHKLTLQMTALCISMIMGLLFLLIAVTRRISRPILDLTNSATQVTETGSYQEAIEIKSRDEIGRLTGAFNEMMEGLRQRDFIRDTFGRYVTKEVVEELLDTSDGLKLGGEIREVTIMFSDLRGFTPLCEHLSPNQVIDVLNGYLSRMSKVISQYKGTINEFIGDAILTFFGAPIKYGDSTARAVACALAMQLAMEGINIENTEKGLPSLFMGIGINTGEVIVGNIGSKERAKYGVVGHNINLASRVQGATLGGQILITPSTFEQVKDLVVVRGVRPVRFKGVEEDIDLYDVVGIKEPYDLVLPDRIEHADPLKKSIPVILTKMHGKKTGSTVLGAELTHFSTRWATVIVSEEIPSLQEVRIDFTGNKDEDRIYLYGKVANLTQQDDHYVHSIQISYLTPMVTLFVEQFSRSE